MNFWSLLILLGGVFLFAPEQAGATHIVGGELTYRCLGNNLYEIRLTLRRDCLLGAPDAQFDDPASIGFFDMTSNQLLSFLGFNGQLLIPFNEDDTLNQKFISDCTIAGSDICVHQTTYVDTIFLPFRPTGYTMAYQRCCRNGSLTNVLNPLNTGMTLMAQLSGFAQTQCNSSPQFGDYPPIYICVNTPFVFDHGATDISSDSLVYCFETPLAGGDMILNMPQPPNPPPYAPIAWRPPYNVFNIMGGVPLTINSQTGLITCTPNTIGQFVVGICVTAYDRETGVLTGRARRDFQFNVRACNDRPSVAFEAPALNCDGLSVSFTNTSINSERFTWTFDFGNPLSDTSNQTSPTYTFPEEGFYRVQLLGYVPDLNCRDTVVKTIGVFNADVVADFTREVVSCTDSITIIATDLSTGTGHPPASWAWLLTYPGGILSSTQQNPSFTFDIDGEALVYLQLVVSDSNGCTSAKIDTFTVRQLDLQLNPQSDRLCFGSSTHLLLNGDPGLTYTWDPTLGLDLSNPWDPVAFPGLTTTYHVTVTDGLCALTDSVTVEVIRLDLEFNAAADTVCAGDSTHILLNGDPTLAYVWLPATGINLAEPWDPVVAVETTTTYFVTVTDGFCTVVDSFIVAATPLPDLDFTHYTDCKSLLAEFLITVPSGNTYHWDFGVTTASNDTSNLANPSFTFPGPGVYTVSLTSYDGCDVTITRQVSINTISETFDDQVVNCFQAGVALNPVFNPGYNYVWAPGSFLDNPNSPNPTATVDDDTWFFVTVTDPALPDCPLLDSVLVVIPDDFSIQLNSREVVSCDFSPITLVASSTAKVIFTWKDKDGNTLAVNDTLTVLPGVSAVTYYVMATDTLGCMKTDSVVILRPDPTFSVVADPDTTYCGVQPITLTASSVAGVTFAWFDLAGVALGSGASLVVMPDTPSCYYVIGTDAIGCQASDTVCLTPVILSVSPEDQATCLGDPVSISVTALNGLGLTYDWFPDTGILSGDGTPTILVNPTESTTYSVNVSTADGGCQTTLTASVMVYTFDPVVIAIDALPDTIFLTASTQLIVNQSEPGLYTYQWFSTTGEVIEGVFNPVVTPTEQGTIIYTVIVTDQYGCQGTASVNVVVENPFCDERDIFLPNAFTPNGDGQNDLLYVRGNYITSIDFHIYNRWGQEVFSTTNQATPWDGTYNGKRLQPDVFGYYLTVYCPNGESYFKKGNITLLE